MLRSLVPQKILVAHRPPRLGGKVEALTPEVFQEKFGFCYHETLDAREFMEKSKQPMIESVTGNLSADALRAQLRQLLASPREDIAICHINDQVGYGVFALSAIPKDTLLCFYSGTLKESQNLKTTEHCAIGLWGMNAIVSTESHRGISSFFQHLPSPLKVPDVRLLHQILRMTGQVVSENALRCEDELYSVTFSDDTVKRSLAMANLRKEYINIDGIPVIVFVTNASVEAGDQLGFNYGYSYWSSRNTAPELFDNSGAIVPHEQYRRTHGHLTFNNETYQGDFKKLIEQLQQGKQQILLENGVYQSAESVANELLRMHALTPHEHQALLSSAKRDTSQQAKDNGFFSHLELRSLVKKYNLTGTCQEALEKGLRNAAFHGNAEDLQIFIRHVHNINARDQNPNSQKTALDWATQKGHRICCDLLIASGAKPETQHVEKQPEQTITRP